jgi:hypothetical protein
MSPKTVTAGLAAVAVGVCALLALQVATVSAAAPEASGVYAMPQIVAQVPTPTPFRFLTPTPIVPRTTTTTSTTTTRTAPNGGAIPLELAVPALMGGLAALGGGTYLLRRKPVR